MKILKFLFLSTFLLLYSSTTYGQVTVEISNVKVNGTAINENPINFNGVNYVSVTCQVKMLTTNADVDNVLGNLFIRTKDLSVNPTTLSPPPYFSAVTFVIQQPISSSTMNVSFYLYANQFYQNGGLLYAEYINNNDTSYKSAQKSITGGSKVLISNPDPTGLTNIICCNQTIRYGDKPNIITGSYINPSGWLNHHWYINNSPNLVDVVQDMNSIATDYLFETITVARNLGNDYPYNNSNNVVVTVVPSPILSNTIFSNAIIMPDGKYEINSIQNLELSGFNPSVNLNILADPFHPNTRGDITADVEAFQWQYKPSNGSWYDIATGSNLLPIIPTTSNSFSIRRIAKYQGISRVSNILQFIVIPVQVANEICCNQPLQVLSTGAVQQPTTIIGSTPVFNASLLNSNQILINYTVSYQWQRQSRTSSWTNIVGATLKDYLPPLPTSRDMVNYRRIVTVIYNYSQVGFPNQNRSYILQSNQVYVLLPSFRREINSDEIVEAGGRNTDLKIYPNPCSAILNIESSNDLSKIKVSLINSVGQIIKGDNLSVINLNLVNIDVSGLPAGFYTLVINDNVNIIRKKLIKK